MKKKKQTILKGSSNQHTLYGEIEMANKPTDFAEVNVLKETILRHEQSNGSFGEHNALIVDKGEWVMGKQVEYNPFKKTISQVWD